MLTAIGPVYHRDFPEQRESLAQDTVCPRPLFAPERMHLATCDYPVSCAVARANLRLYGKEYEILNPITITPDIPSAPHEGSC